MRLPIRLFSVLCFGLSLAFLASGLLALSDGWNRYVYLLDIFSQPIAWAALVCVCLLLLLRQTGPAILTLLAALCLYLSLAPDKPIRDAQGEGAAVRVMFANLLIRNPTPDALMTWINAQSPDIITLVEANHHTHGRLIPALSAQYPYRARRYDMYIMSRFPLDQVKAHEAGFALLSARVSTPEGPITVAVAHLTRPWPFADPADQRRHMQRLVSELKPHTGPLVLTGDFNAANHTGPMHHLRQQLSLTAPAAFGGTWPAPLPVFARIGIDHIMVSSHLTATHHQTGPAYGSDHNPIRTDIHRKRE